MLDDIIHYYWKLIKSHIPRNVESMINIRLGSTTFNLILQLLSYDVTYKPEFSFLPYFFLTPRITEIFICTESNMFTILLPNCIKVNRK